jgi:hypothetical protein
MPSVQEIRAVQKRHPSAEVFGSGSYGAISECYPVIRVALFPSELSATNAVSGQCRAPEGCKRVGHRVEQFVRPGFVPHWDRMVDREEERKERTSRT